MERKPAVPEPYEFCPLCQQGIAELVGYWENPDEGLTAQYTCQACGDDYYKWTVEGQWIDDVHEG